MLCSDFLYCISGAVDAGRCGRWFSAAYELLLWRRKREELAYIKRVASASVIVLGVVMLAVVVSVSDFFPAIFGMSKQSEQFFMWE